MGHLVKILTGRKGGGSLTHQVDVRVRFCETDMAGHVNNTSYFIYLEEARGNFFRDHFPEHLDSVGRFILASTKCDYVSQGYFGQQLAIQSWITNIGNKSFRFNHHIHDRETGKIIAEAEATIVHFNYEKQKSEPIPDELRALLEQHLAFN
ncbi:acyl-CoA thioesterase [Halobacillus karajensis]|uniref:acyl-CoA thioesterase n=1 Tax=Halobacillus karajensis TaxID=195088 RepID=UPI0009436C58